MNLSNKKIIYAWIGTFKSEKKLYEKYLNIDYSNDDLPQSKFGKDVGLEYYDDDFMESWWFKKLNLNELKEYKEDLLDSEHFFDELIIELSKRNLDKRNTILFLFGENGENPINEVLFNHNNHSVNNKRIEFIFRKEYSLK
ncbi:immunity 22 family protein [uncultured Tenacibaculum sp.]|uniref:immunity 22 family protein n=1 Tax=uncultured Tenacibaculum sp. TaxID=174713 RepID=UPI002633F3A2|nr:immunity 22 family protein [uncultured Tenacibaculum sp.]